MKKTSKFILVILTLCFLQKNVIGQNNKQLPAMKPLWSVEQVKEMAKKYNLHDSISATKNNLLLFMTKEQIENYFKDEFKNRHLIKESKEYRSKTKDVRNYKDFLNLLAQYPTMKAKAELSHGGKDGFEKYNRDALNIKWQIYRSNDGGLTFINPASKCATDLSKLQRLDNLLIEKN